jgi:hypothetical protein
MSALFSLKFYSHLTISPEFLRRLAIELKRSCRPELVLQSCFLPELCRELPHNLVQLRRI